MFDYVYVYICILICKYKNYIYTYICLNIHFIPLNMNPLKTANCLRDLWDEVRGPTSGRVDGEETLDFSDVSAGDIT